MNVERSVISANLLDKRSDGKGWGSDRIECYVHSRFCHISLTSGEYGRVQCLDRGPCSGTTIPLTTKQVNENTYREI